VLFVTVSGGERAHNRRKGGAGHHRALRRGRRPPRTAAVTAPEALALGERVRIGYHAGAHRLPALAGRSTSADRSRRSTPSRGRSVPLGKVVGTAPRYLPDSVEFTDTGIERLFVIMSDQPRRSTPARRAARAAFRAREGEYPAHAGARAPGEQFQRTFHQTVDADI